MKSHSAEQGEAAAVPELIAAAEQSLPRRFCRPFAGPEVFGDVAKLKFESVRRLRALAREVRLRL